MNQNYRFMELSQFGTPLHWAAHGVVGGASAEAQGGKFGQGQGFISAAFTKAVSTQGLLPGSKQGELSIERLAGQFLGTAQSLQAIYPGITNHVHVKLRIGDNKVVDPAKYIPLP